MLDGLMTRLRRCLLTDFNSTEMAQPSGPLRNFVYGDRMILSTTGIVFPPALVSRYDVVQVLNPIVVARYQKPNGRLIQMAFIRPGAQRYGQLRGDLARSSIKKCDGGHITYCSSFASSACGLPSHFLNQDGAWIGIRSISRKRARAASSS